MMKRLLLDSFIIRIYRCKKDKPNSLVGVAEKVGNKESLAFTSLYELWGILTSARRGPMQQKRIGVSTTGWYETERRNEIRLKKEIPLVFIFNKRKCNGNTVNCSNNGLGLKIHKQINLPVGNVISLKAKDCCAKAQVVWIDGKSHPAATIAGFRIVEGSLNLTGVRKGTKLMMKDFTGILEPSAPRTLFSNL
jgi:hypothetical protein